MFLNCVDKDIFQNKEYGLKQVGFDTDIDELDKIKETLLRIEMNNPAYLKDYNLTIIEREQVYHRKVDEIISLTKISKAKRTIEKVFSEKSIGQAVFELLQYKDLIIENLIYKKLAEDIGNRGTRDFVKQFEDTVPVIVSDVVLIYEYNKNRNENTFNKLYEAARLGRIYPMAYVGSIFYKGEKFAEKNEKMALLYLKKAAKLQSSLAIAYIGMFYKKGIMGFKCNPSMGNTYLKIANAYGEILAQKELSK